LGEFRWPELGRSDTVAVVETDVVMTTVRIASTSGDVRVIAEDRADVDVPDSLEFSVDDSVMTVSAGSRRALMRVPTGTDLVVGTTSGRVEVTGLVGSLAVTTMSGRVSAESARSVDIRTTSGRIDVGSATGSCRVSTRSGSVVVGRCGEAHLTSMSGRISLDIADGPVHAHCVSGRIDVTVNSAQDVEAETVSGRISVRLPAGVRPQVVERRDDAELASDQYDCVVTARSVNGRIDVVSA
jgi:DUF4097 and DUF4098 domain-containing protein YvlB